MKNKPKKYILFILVIAIVFCGCSQGQAESSGNEMTLDVEEKPEENLEISIHRDFTGWDNAAVYQVQKREYPSEDESWGDDLLAKYVPSFHKTEMNIYKDPATNKVSRSFLSDGGTFLITPDGLSMQKSTEFSENIYLYFRAYGIGTFFHEDMKEYYGQQDLSFMRMKEAKECSDSLIQKIGYQYVEEGCLAYSFDQNALNRYHRDHEQELSEYGAFLEKSAEVAYIPEWKKEDEFYLFYYPCSLNGIQVLPGEIYPLTWSYVILCKDGIGEFSINASFEQTAQQEGEMVSPEEILKTLKRMYQNTILTQKIKVYDLQLQYAFSAYEEAEDQYRVSPVWKFLVEMETNSGNDEPVKAEVTYDAVTGERISY